MKYTLEVEIALPSKRVVELFENPENWPKWQPSLISYEQINGSVGETGSKTRLVHKMGGKEVEMIETVESNNLPEKYTVTYEAKGAWNRVVNSFIEEGPDRTKWVFETEFKCSGFLKVMAFLMPGMFKKQSRKDMQRFKDFAENGVSDA